jgi:hypothetical protein
MRSFQKGILIAEGAATSAPTLSKQRLWKRRILSSATALQVLAKIEDALEHGRQ